MCDNVNEEEEEEDGYVVSKSQSVQYEMVELDDVNSDDKVNDFNDEDEFGDWVNDDRNSDLNEIYHVADDDDLNVNGQDESDEYDEVESDLMTVATQKEGNKLVHNGFFSLVNVRNH